MNPSLSEEEDGDDNDRHHGDPEGVSPLHLLSLVMTALTRVESSVGVLSVLSHLPLLRALETTRLLLFFSAWKTPASRRPLNMMRRRQGIRWIRNTLSLQ